MSEIKIFVSHRIDLESCSFKSSILCPIRCGAIYDRRPNVTTLGDDTGDNISERRMTFNELTVQYWAWKNVDVDYYGLFHYRRFFNFQKVRFPEDSFGSVIDNYINDDTARTYGIQDKTISKMVEQYDLIVPERRDISTAPGQPHSVREQWIQTPYLYESDLQTMLEIISEMHPDYNDTAMQYLNGKYAYYCLIHIMKKEVFQAYCEWLYPMLFKIEQKIDIHDSSQERQRIVGHLAERLFGIYILYIRKHKPQLKLKELQTVLFQETKFNPAYLYPAFPKVESAIPIVFASNDAFASVCAVAISSLISHSDPHSFYDIVIIESDVSDKNKSLILSMIKNCNNISIRFFNAISMISKYHLSANNHITVETYYRFLIQEILPQYDKVLYLDGDIVCNKDVAELYYTELGDNLLAAAHDPDMCGQLNMPDSDTLRYLYREVHMKNPYDYFQAGVLVLNTREMRKVHTMDEWLSFAQTWYRYSDQDVLNRYCQGRVLYLDMRWNLIIDCDNYRVSVIINEAPGSIKQEYHKSRKDPHIVHFAGHQKPWKQRNVDMEEVFWQYARTTPYYEKLLSNILAVPALSNDGFPPIGVKGTVKIYIRKKLNKWFPKGTKRRSIGGRLFGKLFRKMGIL